MKYIYKLIDTYELELAQKNIISFSHPIFEFKGSEGKFINFAKNIYDEYIRKGLKIKPKQKDLIDIKQWYNVYKKTYGNKFNDWDIKSESMIIFCGIMQGFCGCFTTANLFDKSIRDNYLSKCKLKNKIAVIKINENVFEHLHWRSKKVEGEYVRFDGYPNDCNDFNGFMHPTEIKYSKNYDDYNELLKIYNSNELRNSSTWFNILSDNFEWQKEKRIIFLLKSLEPNSSRTGCDVVYKPQRPYISWEEVVYGKIVDAIDYCSKGPRYVSLKLNDGDIEILNL